MVIARFVLLGLVGIPIAAHAQSENPRVVMLIAEGEYATNKTLPKFAEQHLEDYRTTFVYEDPEDPNSLIGIDAVKDADVLIVSVRRRTLKPEQLSLVRRYVESGHPVIGIRTASHAFSLRDREPPQGRAVWPEFDQQVFGGNYTNHHGNDLKATIQLARGLHEVTKASLLPGIHSIRPFESGGSLYRVSPLAEGTVVLMTGKVDGHPAEPVAWVYQRSDGGKSFYTSLGHVDDFAGDVLPRLLQNAITWCLD